jgi:hypothetical protein
VNPETRSSSKRWVLAVAVLLLLSAGLSFAMQPEPGSAVAPLLGPWAGIALGHSDCTLGNQIPGASLGLAAVGVLLAVGLGRSKRHGARVVVLSLGLVWVAAWELSALLSVLNTTS